MTSNNSINNALRGPIGVFDSGFGGLTVLNAIRRHLPHYQYIYLGDNARAPYGSRSFDMVYEFTLEAVNKLFDLGCPLVILACNTASAKALRTIQQNDLPRMADPTRRVLGVIRPTAEAIGDYSKTRHIGIFATPGTIGSGSYDIEIKHLHPDCTVTGHACRVWVPLIEAGEADTPGADYFIKRDIDSLLAKDPHIDTIVLGCTHYPIISDKIRQHLPENINLVSQGEIVAKSLADYLSRHPEMERRLSRVPATSDITEKCMPETTEKQVQKCPCEPPANGVTYLTTENPERFDTLASIFVGHPVSARHITL